MKKRIIFAVITALAVSFSSAGFAQKKKADVKPVANPNPLVGTWVTLCDGEGACGAYVIFTADTVKIIQQTIPAGVPIWALAANANYTYSASPLKLTGLVSNRPDIPMVQKIGKIDVKYTLKDDILTMGYDLTSVDSSINQETLTISDYPYKLIRATPLTGTWVISKGSYIRFFADTVKILYTAPGSSRNTWFTGTCTYSASPLKIETDSGTVTLSYKITGNQLTYRFINTGSKEYEGIEKEFYQKYNAKSKKMADADFVGVKKPDYGK